MWLMAQAWVPGLRYCYYTAAADDRVYRCDIDHAPWMLARADAEIGTNTLVAFRLDLPRTSPLLHYTEHTDARICRRDRRGMPTATECRGEARSRVDT